jgi:hypothetical protein
MGWLWWLLGGIVLLLLLGWLLGWFGSEVNEAAVTTNEPTAVESTAAEGVVVDPAASEGTVVEGAPVTEGVVEGEAVDLEGQPTE